MELITMIKFLHALYLEEKLEYPHVHSDTFGNYHLYSVSKINQSIIISPYTYHTMSDNQFQYQEHECQGLQPNYLCENDNLFRILGNFVNENTFPKLSASTSRTSHSKEIK